MELLKDVSAVIGFILSAVSLITLVVKPLRKKFVNWIAGIAGKTDTANTLADLKDDMSIMKTELREMRTDMQSNTDTQKQKIDTMQDKLEQIEKNVLDNEADRLRSELFDCGNRCRREIRLHPEEMDHIRDVFKKYSNVLKQNGTGESEYMFIQDYYNHQDFPAYHKRVK